MRKWVPLVTVCLGSFMLLVDTTIVNVALPDVARSLHTSFASLQWVVDAYALTLAALVLAAGSVADLAGHRRTYVLGMIVFAFASLACALAASAQSLVAARAIQGIGAAAMLAATFPLLNSNYAGRERGVAYGVWGAVNGAASMSGPLLGGLLTQTASWRWIFFVNLPLALVATGMRRSLRTEGAAALGRIDVLGTASFAAAAGSVTYGLIKANEHGWGGLATWMWLVAAPVCLTVFVVAERHATFPMLDLTLLRSRTLVGVLIGAGALTCAAFGPYTYAAIWMQSVLDLSPLAAGLVAIPLSAAAFVVSVGIGRHLHESHPGRIIGSGLLLIGIGGLVSAALLQGTATWSALIPGSVITGLGVGLATPTLASMAMRAVPVTRGGMAAGSVNTMRQLGFAFGVAALGAIFVNRATSLLAARGLPRPGAVAERLAGGQAHLVLQSAPVTARGTASEVVQAAALNALHWTYLACGALGLVAGMVVLALVRDSGGSATRYDTATKTDPNRIGAGI